MWARCLGLARCTLPYFCQCYFRQYQRDMTAFIAIVAQQQQAEVSSRNQPSQQLKPGALFCTADIDCSFAAPRQTVDFEMQVFCPLLSVAMSSSP